MTSSDSMTQPLALRADRYIGMGLAWVDGNDAWRLICACVDGDSQLVESLLAADPELANVQYWYATPLSFAVRANRVEVARLLIERGADPTTGCYCARAWGDLLEVAELRGLDSMAALLGDEMARRFGFSVRFAPLAAAIRAYDTTAVGEMLAAEPGLLDATDGGGNGAVHWATMTHQPELLSWLGEQGADLDCRRADGRTPVLVSIHGDYDFRWWRDVPEVRRRAPEEMTDALLRAGARCPFGLAVLRGDLDTVAARLRTDPERAVALDSGRTSALCYASFGQQEGMTELLLAHGAEPNRPEALAPRGRALFEAAARNNLAQARMLLAAGADPDAEVDSSGNCLWVVANQHPQDAGAMLELLSNHGAQPASWQLDAEELRETVRSGRRGPGLETLWTDVLGTGDAELLDALIDRDPAVPGMLSAWVFRKDTGELVATPGNVARLIAAGYDPDRGDWQGATLLHYCARFDDAEVAADLLAQGADVDRLEIMHGGTPLATAARHACTSMLELLLAAGADPEHPAERDWATPVQQARRAGHASIVARLTDLTGP